MLKSWRRIPFAESNLTHLRCVLEPFDRQPTLSALSESATSAPAPFLRLIAAVKTYLSCVPADMRKARPVGLASKALLRALSNKTISFKGLRQASVTTRFSQTGAVHVSVDTSTGLKLSSVCRAEPKIRCYAADRANTTCSRLNATSTAVSSLADFWCSQSWRN